MKSLVVFLSLLALAAARPADDSLRGAQVLRVVPERESQVHYLNGLMKQDTYDFWREPKATGLAVDIMAPAFHLPALKKTLDMLKLDYEVMISNVYDLIEEEARIQEAARAKSTKMDWVAYHTYDEIMAWMEELSVTYPLVCSVEDVGTSYEGRTMKLLTVGTGDASNPGVFVDGGIHAREWISPATVTYIMNELITNSETYKDILASVNFYFMPSINPDGYAYTFSDDRMWRKTRSPTDSAVGCVGADPNRNWSFHWMEIGASDSPCSDIYAGPMPFSEVEMQVVRDQINIYKSTLVSYLTFHAYSQLWMYPWGFTTDLPDDWQDLDALAQDAVSALTAVYGTAYDIGSSTNTIYAAAGGSDDWAKGEAGVKYSYTIELRDTGTYGFILPANQIIPSGEETFQAFLVYANFFKDMP